MALRITQLPVETLLDQDPSLRITHLPVETLLDQDPALRITHLPVETLLDQDPRLWITQAVIEVIIAADEVAPEVGQSFGPLVWVEWEATDGTSRVWAPVDLPDPVSYYLGYKSPWLLSAGRVVRALSDEQGEYQGQTFDVTVNDISRDLRTLLGTSDGRRHLLNTRGVMRMISQADWRLQRTPRTVAIGELRGYRLH